MINLNILCIGQESPSTAFEGNQTIFVRHANTRPTIKIKMPFKSAPVMNYIDGIWYMLQSNPNELSDTAICDFTPNYSGAKPYWITDREILEHDIRTLIIRENYLDSFRCVIQSLLEQSPIGKVVVLCHYNAGAFEGIVGSLEMDEFFDMLYSGRIFTNICYFVGKNGEFAEQDETDYLSRRNFAGSQITANRRR